jgi:hypothetical protein
LHPALVVESRFDLVQFDSYAREGVDEMSDHAASHSGVHDHHDVAAVVVFDELNSGLTHASPCRKG